MIRVFSDPALRMKARDVSDFSALASLVRTMRSELVAASGVGLAAPQVGNIQRVFMLRFSDQIVVCVNPSITVTDSTQIIEEEGCLSLPGLLVPVARPAAVSVIAFDERETEFQLSLSGFEARAASHEMDHLDGVMIIERAIPEARAATRRNFRLALSAYDLGVLPRL